MLASTLLLLSCAVPAEPADDTGQATTAAEDGGTTGTTSADPFCADAPLVNYNNFGQGFMSTSCQGCHASTTANRYGAPEHITFDTVEEVWAWADTILLVVVGEGATMPPAGGVTEDDQTRLRWWLQCGEPGT